jgi:hypothetical protein
MRQEIRSIVSVIHSLVAFGSSIRTEQVFLVLDLLLGGSSLQ